MPTVSQTLRSQPMKQSDSSQQIDSPLVTTTRPRHPFHPAPPAAGLSDLIRALENSPPDKDGPNIDDKFGIARCARGNRTHVSVLAYGLIQAQENSLVDELSDICADIDAAPINASAVASKRPAVSDDDSGALQEKRKKARPHDGRRDEKIVAKPAVRSMEDFKNTIDDAVREQRIDEKKALRLQECLQVRDWSQIAFNLLCEQIPLKRNGRGYFCRVCSVPKKGHTCLYCHVCSTSEIKFKKDDDHVCFNCVACFEHGKKNKKLIQVKSEGHVCPHRASYGKRPRNGTILT